MPVTIDTDPALMPITTRAVASQKATKAYADTKIATGAIDIDVTLAHRKQ